MSSRWVTVHKAAQRLRRSRWEVLLMALRKELNYRPTANGVEISEASVARLEKGEKADVTAAEAEALEPATV